MTGEIEISPPNPRSGAAISVTVTLPSGMTAPVTLEVKRTDKKGGESFQTLLHPLDSNRYITEFAVFESGPYSLQVGDTKRIFVVAEQRDLTFLIEFGLLAVFVILFLGGLIRWNKVRLNLK